MCVVVVLSDVLLKRTNKLARCLILPCLSTADFSHPIAIHFPCNKKGEKSKYNILF